jgi:radical SAM protein with 4Fe4S-binding SPASM domain
MSRSNREPPLRRSLRRAAHPLYRKLETIVHPLRYLFLEITQRCNLRCLHCGSDCGQQPRDGELSADEWLDFIDYLARLYPDRRGLFLVITGGEPLCHPRLDQILERIASCGFPYGMVTNGYALDRKAVRKLVDRRISSVTVSLDGMRESHEWLRGVEGSFDRAVEGLRILAGQPVRFLDAVTCVNPRNLDELPGIMDLLQRIGVRRWRLFSIFPKGRARDNGELLLSDDGIRRLMAWIEARRAELHHSDFALDFSCEGYLPPAVDRAVRDEPYFCRAGISIGSVLCDGAISACPNITRQLVQGNIRQDDFASVWEDGFRPFRDRAWMRTGDCAGCGHWGRCLGNSLHLWDDDARRTVLCHHRILEETR